MNINRCKMKLYYVMRKHMYVTSRANLISRRSLNNNGGVGRIILTRNQEMCKHRFIISAINLRSRRSLTIFDGAVNIKMDSYLSKPVKFQR